MARKRMIDPNIWQSEDFSRLSTLAKLVFIGMFSNADDEGRGRAKAAYLKSILFPYDEVVRIIDVDKTLSEIGSNMSVTFYSHDGNEYYTLNKWSKWQRVEKPQNSLIPAFSDECKTIRGTVGEQSSMSRRTVVDESRLVEEKVVKEKLREENCMLGEKVSPSQQPTITLMLNDKSEYPITKEQLIEWAELYPAVDVIQQLRNMKGWLNANPEKRKTKSGIQKFINRWLSKEQNQGGGSYASNTGNSEPAKPKHNPYAELEADSYPL